MPRLQGRILPIVCEAQKLACAFLNRAVGLHPRQDGRDDERRRRTAAFSRQARQLVDVACLLGRLMTTMGTETIFSAEEPGGHPIVAERPVRLHKKELPLMLAAMPSLQTLLSG